MCFVFIFLFFIRYAAISQINKFVKGPAKAISANCRLEPDPAMLTKAGTKTMKPKFRSFIINPNIKQM